MNPGSRARVGLDLSAVGYVRGDVHRSRRFTLRGASGPTLPSCPPSSVSSNERWYDGKLRIMTDERHKRFGGPEQPVMQLHQVENGVLSNGSQENEVEAQALGRIPG